MVKTFLNVVFFLPKLLVGQGRKPGRQGVAEVQGQGGLLLLLLFVPGGQLVAPLRPLAASGRHIWAAARASCVLVLDPGCVANPLGRC